MTIESHSQPQAEGLSSDLVKYFYDHVVGLLGVYIALDDEGRPKGGPYSFSFSGFVLSQGEQWYLISAGHAVKDLNDRLQKRHIRLESCRLLDCLGSRPLVTEPTPFDYESTTKYFVDDDELGLDFAVIVIGDFFKESLRANGIRPFVEENWSTGFRTHYDFLAMLGFPEALVDEPLRLRQYGNTLTATVCPAMLFLRQEELAEDQLPNSGYPWFTARIISNNYPDIKGMSGGPILGFVKDNGQMKYWIVAVQSKWRRKQGIVFGCPVALFMKLLDLYLRATDTTEDGATRKTLDDLYHTDAKAELIGGRIVTQMPTGLRPSEVSGNIYASLREHARQTKRGRAFPDNLGYAIAELPSGRESFNPDASYYEGPLPANTMRFIEGPPTFAAEVRSENDYTPSALAEQEAKRADYFQAGTKVVWDIDPVNEVVYVYKADAPAQPVAYRRGQVAEAEPAVPGWRMPVDEVFA